jgi:hypothetical protein
MNARYSGDLELDDVQRRLLSALLAGPMATADVVARGAALAALHLRANSLVEWVYPNGWRLTPDGAEIANRIASCRAHEKGTGG